MASDVYRKAVALWGLLLNGWVAIALGLSSFQSVAAPALADIEELYKQGDVKQAYALAQQLVYANEGDPEFDFLYGKIAIDSGHPGQGVFALERVLLATPSNAVARLELARGYYLLEAYDLAQQQFSIVEATPDIPQVVRRNIADYQKSIKNKQRRYTTNTTTFAEFTLGYDTNINSATDEATFITPTLGTGTFSDDSLAQKALYAELDVGVSVSHPLDERRSLFGVAALSQRKNNDNANYDLDTIKLRGGLNVRNAKQLYRATANAQFTQLDHRSYRYLGNVILELQHQMNPRQRINSYVQVGSIVYPKLDDRDVYSYGAGFGLLHYFRHSMRPSLSGMLYINNNQPHDKNETASAVADKSVTGFMLNGALRPDKDSSVRLSMLAQNTRHAGQDSTFLVTRSDDYYKLGLEYSQSVTDAMSIKLGASYSEVNSNIAIYDYDREQWYVGLRYDY